MSDIESPVPPVPLWRPPVQTIAVTVILAVFGVALIVQSNRWSHTPAYGNLLRIFSADTWGVVHLIIAVAMVTGMALRSHRWIRLAAHTLSGVLLLSWEAAFFIRWVSDTGTTVANVVAWGVYVWLAMWATKLIDSHAYEISR